MDRQTVRQQTGVEVRHRSGTSRRLQPLAGCYKQAAVKSPSQAQFARSSPRQRKRAHSPWLLFVFGLWVVSLASAVLATRSLLDPNVASSSFAGITAIEGPEAAVSPSEPVAASPVTEESNLPGAALDESYFYQPPETGHLPIVALGSIALSCAMGCILVSRALHPRRSPPRLLHRSAKPGDAQHTAAKSHRQGRATSAAEPPATPVPQMPPMLPAQIVHPPRDEGKPATPAIVAVLPADQAVPLDWKETSLADSLDLRQRQSLRF